MSKQDTNSLSEREEQVLLLSTKGLTDKEIARKLELSIATVNTYWVRIRTKLGGANRAELVASALMKNSEETLTAKELENQRLISEIIRRADAERALIEAQRQLQTLIDGTPVVIYVKDEHGRYTMVNAEFERLVGKTSKEIIGRRDVDLFPLDVAEAYRVNDRLVLDTGRSAENEDIFTTENGPLTYLTVKFALTDAEGNRTGVCGFSHDITGRKRLEHRLGIQYASTRILAEARSMDDAMRDIAELFCKDLGFAHAGIWMIEGKRLKYDGGWQEPELASSEFMAATTSIRFGIGEGLPGRVWETGEFVFIPDILEDTNLPRAEAAAKSGITSALGFPVKIGGEVVSILECFGKEIHAPSDEMMETLSAIGSQIGQFSERVQAEEDLRIQNADFKEALQKLHESEVELWRHSIKLSESSHTTEIERQRYLELFQGAPDGYVVTDLKGNVQEINPAACTLLERTRQELMGSQLLKFVQPDKQRDFQSEFESVVKSGRAREWEVDFARTGKPLEASVSAVVVTEDHHVPDSVRWLIRDISRRKWAESEFKAAQDVLELRLQKGSMDLEDATQKLAQEVEERRQAEDSLLDTHRFANTVIESCTDGIAAFDKECRFTAWNPAMEKISGLSKQEVIGQIAFDVFPFLIDIGEDRLYYAALRGETVESEGKPFSVSSSGKAGYFNGRYVPLRNDGGEVIGGLAFIREVPTAEAQVGGKKARVL